MTADPPKQARLLSFAPSRRQALGLGAAACIAKISRPPTAAPPDPDAELLDLCRQLDDDSRALQHYEAMDLVGWTQADQDQADVLMFRVHDTIEAISTVPATTRAGIHAKADALGHALKQAVAVETGLTFEEQAEDYELLAMSLVRDLGREAIHG
jgi:hypothetical protein